MNIDEGYSVKQTRRLSPAPIWFSLHADSASRRRHTTPHGLEQTRQSQYTRDTWTSSAMRPTSPSPWILFVVFCRDLSFFYFFTTPTVTPGSMTRSFVRSFCVCLWFLSLYSENWNDHPPICDRDSCFSCCTAYFCTMSEWSLAYDRQVKMSSYVFRRAYQRSIGGLANADMSCALFPHIAVLGEYVILRSKNR